MLDPHEPDTRTHDTTEQPAPPAPRRRRAASRPAGPPSTAPNAPEIERPHGSPEPVSEDSAAEITPPAEKTAKKPRPSAPLRNALSRLLRARVRSPKPRVGERPRRPWPWLPKLRPTRFAYSPRSRRRLQQRSRTRHLAETGVVADVALEEEPTGAAAPEEPVLEEPAPEELRRRRNVSP